MPSIIFEDENFLVTASLHPGETIIATFAHMDFYTGVAGHWGQSVLDGLGISSLGLVCKFNSWFPRRYFEKSLAAATDVLKGYRVKIAYGFSMGGYGALKYGNALGINKALCLSPQVSIDPSYSVDRRFSRFYDPTLNEDMAVKAEDLADKVYIVFDPLHEMDVLNFSTVSEMAGTRLRGIRCFHIGHDTPHLVASSVVLREAMAAVERDDYEGLERVFTAARRGHRRRALGLALASLSKRPELSEAIMLTHGKAIGEYWSKSYEDAKAGI